MKHYPNQLDNRNISFIYIFLALFALNFQDNGIAILFLGMIILIFTNFRFGYKLSFDLWLLYAFALFYFLFTGFSNTEMGFSEILRGLALPVAFFIGLNLYPNNDIKKIKKVIYILSIFMALHGILNLFYNFSRLGTGVLNNVIGLYDIWSGTISSATGQSSTFLLLAGIFYYSLFVQQNKKIKIVIFILFVLAFYYNFALGGRTFFILILLACISGFLLHFYYSIKERVFVRKIFPVIFFIGLIILGVIYAYQNNIGGLRDTVESSYWYHRFFSTSGQDLSEDSRLDRKMQYISLFFTYMFGGNHIRIDNGVGYAHDLWLDIYDAAGIIPFIIIFVYTLRAWIRAFSMLNDKKIESGFKVIFGSYTLVVSAYFFIEPIMYGAPLVLFSFCIIDGLVASYLTQKKQIVID